MNSQELSDYAKLGFVPNAYLAVELRDPEEEVYIPVLIREGEHTDHPVEMLYRTHGDWLNLSQEEREKHDQFWDKNHPSNGGVEMTPQHEELYWKLINDEDRWQSSSYEWYPGKHYDEMVARQRAGGVK